MHVSAGSPEGQRHGSEGDGGIRGDCEPSGVDVGC